MPLSGGIGDQGQISAEALAEMGEYAFAFYAASFKPPALRLAWEFDRNDCMPAAVPLARCINRLPPRLVELAIQAADPLMAAGALWGLVRLGARREQELIDAYNAGLVAGQAGAQGATAHPSAPEPAQAGGDAGDRQGSGDPGKSPGGLPI